MPLTKLYNIVISPSGDGWIDVYKRQTGGTLKVKDLLCTKTEGEDETLEKVNQIRIYSGEKYEVRQEAEAGEVCAVTGLQETYPGQGLDVYKRQPLSCSVTSKLFRSITSEESIFPTSPRSFVRTLFSAASEKSAIFFCVPTPYCRIAWEL